MRLHCRPMFNLLFPTGMLLQRISLRFNSRIACCLVIHSVGQFSTESCVKSKCFPNAIYLLEAASPQSLSAMWTAPVLRASGTKSRVIVTSHKPSLLNITLTSRCLIRLYFLRYTVWNCLGSGGGSVKSHLFHGNETLTTPYR